MFRWGALSVHLAVIVAAKKTAANGIVSVDTWRVLCFASLKLDNAPHCALLIWCVLGGLWLISYLFIDFLVSLAAWIHTGQFSDPLRISAPIVTVFFDTFPEKLHFFT